MKKANLEAAKNLGTQAFLGGKARVPALCPELVSMHEGRDVGDKRTTKELLAWISGWTQASLAN